MEKISQQLTDKQPVPLPTSPTIHGADYDDKDFPQLNALAVDWNRVVIDKFLPRFRGVGCKCACLSSTHVPRVDVIDGRSATMLPPSPW